MQFGKKLISLLCRLTTHPGQYSILFTNILLFFIVGIINFDGLWMFYAPQQNQW